MPSVDGVGDLGDVSPRDLERAVAAFRLLRKFHIETGCGRSGMHWAECDALASSFGFLNWEVWERTVAELPELLQGR